MGGDVMTFTQGANPTVSDHHVGISNIFDRELPDAGGTVASRASAVLVIFDPAKQTTRRETVIANSIVAIKDDRYCVVAITHGRGERGTISLRKLAR